MGQSGKDPLNIVFNYAWPLACLVRCRACVPDEPRGTAFLVASIC